MKNKKGFTLVELLSVIVLISLLLGLGIPGISRISKNMKERSYKTKVNLIEQAAVLWGQDNKTRLQSDDCDIDGVGNDIKCYKILVNELIENDYLDSESQETISYKNPKTDVEMVYNYVYIYKKNNRVYAKYNDNDIYYNLYAEDNVISGDMHYVNSFKIIASGFGNKTYSWDGINYVSYPSGGIEVNRDFNNKTLYVKFKEGTKEENLQYNVKIDIENPIAQITGITYNTFNSVATLNLSATDNTGIVSYKITKGSCDTDDGYQPWNNINSYTFNNASEQNGEFRFCVKDKNGNIGTSNTQYVANCKVNVTYTCTQEETDYLFFWTKWKSSFAFYISSDNTKDLYIKYDIKDDIQSSPKDFKHIIYANISNKHENARLNYKDGCDSEYVGLPVYVYLNSDHTSGLCYQTTIYN